MHSKSGVIGKRLCKGHPESTQRGLHCATDFAEEAEEGQRDYQKLSLRKGLTKYQGYCILGQISVFNSKLPLEVDLPIWHSLRVYKEEYTDRTW